VPSRAARDAFIASLQGRECYIGGDLSEKIDLTSLVFIFPRPVVAGAVAAAGAGQALTVAIDVVSYFWMPAATLLQRAKEDNIQYSTWRDEAFITATPGVRIDHDAMVDFAIEEARSRGWRIRGIGIDQAGAAAVMNRFERHFGEELVAEVPQGFRMLSSPSKTLEALILSRNLQHDGNPVMSMCIGNMGKEENHWREIRPVKLHQRKRIDGGVALIDAICTMERTDGEGGESVYEGRGVVAVGGA
jgi:phage terminase large subunit-like protein